MAVSSTSPTTEGWGRIKLLLALSRTPHGLLDMTTPAFAALVWLGNFPPVPVVLLGLLTAFAGYTAVYALNDVIDYRRDKEKLETSFFLERSDLDAILVRHPMAQGYLSLGAGIAWTLGWAAVAIIGAYLLNPICVAIFLGGCVLEALYCLLLKITHHRIIISGGVKTTGAMAAVFAVDPAPAPAFLIVLFLLFFFWEIGGQNVPNDWSDMEEDVALHVKTVPVRLGPERSLVIILGSLILTLVLTVLVFRLSRTHYAPYQTALALTAGLVLLIRPAWHLYRTKRPADAMAFFNTASLFPPSLLAVTLINIVGNHF